MAFTSFPPTDSESVRLLEIKIIQDGLSRSLCALDHPRNVLSRNVPFDEARARRSVALWFAYRIELDTRTREVVEVARFVPLLVVPFDDVVFIALSAFDEAHARRSAALWFAYRIELDSRTRQVVQVARFVALLVEPFFDVTALSEIRLGHAVARPADTCPKNERARLADQQEHRGFMLHGIHLPSSDRCGERSSSYNQ